MVEVEYLTIAEFAERAGVSKQAIYKQVNNENSQITPFVLREGKKTLIKVSALSELYGVDTTQSTQATPIDDKETTFTTQATANEVEEATPPTTADNPASTAEFQPISTDYIEFLKAQITELKAEKADVEQRLNATIKEKDGIIKDQSAQLSLLAQQVAQIADKALIATSQQQYLTAMEKTEKQVEPIQAEEPPPAEPIEEDKPKKSFFQRLFGR